ncbi:hypothetical protein QNI19_38900 [Cytophagaceae bacterium DM2B3-1]|uniref:Sugar-binding protein n=1 Tax=Xanthocytophaga flava TaxID=3048013 RepID=A0ABT7CYV1_9BACT|nr:hypothetical protein [Xanthocytophaga flavus]MDJ1498960.1 hypothetical protein [Xanthocytophaga flavus]
MIKRLLSLVFIGGMLFTSCKSDSDETPTPESEKTCKVIQSKTITLSPNSSGDTTTTNYEYNSQGYPTSQNSTSSKNGITTRTFTYNSEGFLTEEVTETTGSYSYRQVITYTYADGKLAKKNAKFTSNTTNYLLDHYYNPDGRFSYLVYNGTPQDIDSLLYGYTDGKLTSIRERFDHSGNKINHSYTITTDTKGLVTSKIEGNNKQLYQYNSYGEKIRLDMYSGEQLYAYQISEYDDKKRIDEITYPLFKGHTPLNEEGLFVHNPTKFISYNVIPNQPDKVSYSNTYEYEYGAHGYPTKVVSKQNWGEEPTVITTTYTFSCQ